MSAFTALRRSHQHTQLNDAPPDRVFPLLCPVREAEWVPGWKHQMIYSESGVAEDGCVFMTPNESGPETVWQVTCYDPSNFRIAFAWVRPGLVATQLRISLSPARAAKPVRTSATSIRAFRPRATAWSSATRRNGLQEKCRAGKRRSIISSAPAGFSKRAPGNSGAFPASRHRPSMSARRRRKENRGSGLGTRDCRFSIFDFRISLFCFPVSILKIQTPQRTISGRPSPLPNRGVFSRAAAASRHPPPCPPAPAPDTRHPPLFPAAAVRPPASR